jgi:CheY-like chemotaxis protein
VIRRPAALAAAALPLLACNDVAPLAGALTGLGALAAALLLRNRRRVPAPATLDPLPAAPHDPGAAPRPPRSDALPDPGAATPPRTPHGGAGLHAPASASLHAAPAAAAEGPARDPSRTLAAVTRDPPPALAAATFREPSPALAAAPSRDPPGDAILREPSRPLTPTTFREPSRPLTAATLREPSRPLTAATLREPSRPFSAVPAGFAGLAPPDRAGVDATRGPGGAGGERILVADDDPVMRRMLTLMLTRLGYTVDSVGDGELAAQQASAVAYAAVLLDVEMPRADGPTAARAIRERGGRMVLLALTGHDDAAETARCRAAGIDDVIIKPVTLEILRAVLERALGPRPEGVDLSVIRRIVADDGAAIGVELIDVFLQELARDREAIDRAAAAGEREAVRRAAHRLRGSASAVGATRLTEACRALESAARDGGGLDEPRAAVDVAATGAREGFERARDDLRGAATGA